MKMAKRNLGRCFGVLVSLLLASPALSPAVAEATVASQTATQTATSKTSVAGTLRPTSQQNDQYKDWQKGYRRGYYAGSGDYSCYLHVPSVGGSTAYKTGYRAGYKAGWKNHHCVPDKPGAEALSYRFRKPGQRRISHRPWLIAPTLRLRSRRQCVLASSKGTSTDPRR